MTITQNSNFITWQIPVDYSAEYMNNISDQEIVEAQKEVAEGKVISSSKVLNWIESLDLKTKMQ